ncbi:auxin-responsive protein SAUR36-like [Actinidia eriantha]|uniref:auxin-responsive protein SAUR36-like n=1 Tax=Actinidia eriantha TaxID=165200 RepID=UPI002582D9A2|nr:auxin-responsive protein SAUR36-like [Actinidia eriantha]
MNKIRVFKLKHRVTTLFRLVTRKIHTQPGYHRVDSETRKPKAISRLLTCIKSKAMSLWDSDSGRGYKSLDKAEAVPKGRLAVYVGQKDGGFHRVVVPVVYFNHPLFGELLREAEDEFGFNHPGGITIPCRISDFERVQTRIAATGKSCRKLLTWKKAF